MGFSLSCEFNVCKSAFSLLQNASNLGGSSPNFVICRKKVFAFKFPKFSPSRGVQTCNQRSIRSLQMCHQRSNRGVQTCHQRSNRGMQTCSNRGAQTSYQRCNRGVQTCYQRSIRSVQTCFQRSIRADAQPT